MNKIFAIVLSIILIISLAACGTGVKQTSNSLPRTVNSNNAYIINGKEQQITPYYPIEDNYVMNIVAVGYNKFHIYDSRSVTGDLLMNRTESDRIIVERVIAIITNKERNGDAEILNTNSGYNYISYYGTDLDYKTGTIMLTYLMYNPDTDYEGDIIERYDYVLDRNFEK